MHHTIHFCYNTDKRDIKNILKYWKLVQVFSDISMDHLFEIPCPSTKHTANGLQSKCQITRIWSKYGWSKDSFVSLADGITKHMSRESSI